MMTQMAISTAGRQVNVVAVIGCILMRLMAANLQQTALCVCLQLVNTMQIGRQKAVGCQRLSDTLYTVDLKVELV